MLSNFLFKFTREHNLCISLELALLASNLHVPIRLEMDEIGDELGQLSLWIEDESSPVLDDQSTQAGCNGAEEDGGHDFDQCRVLGDLVGILFISRFIKL